MPLISHFTVVLSSLDTKLPKYLCDRMNFPGSDPLCCKTQTCPWQSSAPILASCPDGNFKRKLPFHNTQASFPPYISVVYAYQQWNFLSVSIH